jgi:MFS family permease
MGLSNISRANTAAVAFAAFVAFMGIGVVDPLLPLIGRSMGATPFDVEWLFTSYIAVMSISMFISGSLSTRLGGKNTLIAGLAIVVIFSTLSGLSTNIPMFAVFRGGWGLGNALFTSTALVLIVGFSSNVARSVTLYEAALGLGIASGPLLGGFLGSYYWRYPFFGTASLMAIGLVFTLVVVREPPAKEPHRTARQIIEALKNKAVFTNSLSALGYYFGFFTILAYSPLTLQGISTMGLGVVYFLWGLLIAASSVFVFPRVTRKTKITTLLATNLALLVCVFLFLGYFPQYRLFLVVLSGFLCGVANTAFTTLAMTLSPFTRSVSSASYNFLRWAGAAVAPIMAGFIGEEYGLAIPFYIAAAVVLSSLIISTFMLRPLESSLRRTTPTQITVTAR